MSFKRKVSETWESLKAWFKNSETILIARSTAFVGFVTAAFASADWSQLVSFNFGMGFSWKQLLSLGVSALIGGLLLEWARRRNSNI